MDTAQRGMGLDWAATQELIRRSVAEAKAVGGQLACGAGTDQIVSGTLDEVRRAYEEQLAFVEGEGAPAILMASRALGGRGVRPGRLPVRLRRAAGAGELAGDPALAGRHVRPAARRVTGARATSTRRRTWCIDIIEAHAVEGRRDQGLAARRVARGGAAPAAARGRAHVHRRRLQLPGADPRRHGYSDALLGIFDAIAPVAAAAMHALDDGDLRRVRGAVRADRAAVAPHLRRAHAVLQDGRRVPRLPERSPGPLPDGRRAGERPLRPASRRSCSCSPTRPGCCATPSSPSERMRHVLALAGVA